MKNRPAANLFVSFKTSRAIPCARMLRRDFMIQATLDAGVRRIDFHPMVALDDHMIQSETIVVDRDDGRYAIDFVDARPESDPLAEGLLQLAFEERCTGIMTVKASDVRSEPRLSAAREVWRHADVNINAGDRAQVLDALDHEGPVPLRSLDGLTTTSRNVTTVVYALACEGSVSIDLSAGLDGRAIVRLGIPNVAAAGPRLRFGT
jgi:hypothetical protein